MPYIYRAAPLMIAASSLPFSYGCNHHTFGSVELPARTLSLFPSLSFFPLSLSLFLHVAFQYG